MRRSILALASAVAATMLAGCSQVASLTPVGESSITSVRSAANNVLVDQ